MHKVEFYQVPKSNAWRWKFMYNGAILARSESLYLSQSAAKKAFKGVVKGMLKIDFSKI